MLYPIYYKVAPGMDSGGRYTATISVAIPAIVNSEGRSRVASQALVDAGEVFLGEALNLFWGHEEFRLDRPVRVSKVYATARTVPLLKIAIEERIENVRTEWIGVQERSLKQAQVQLEEEIAVTEWTEIY